MKVRSKNGKTICRRMVNKLKDYSFNKDIDNEEFSLR